VRGLEPVFEIAENGEVYTRDGRLVDDWHKAHRGVLLEQQAEWGGQLLHDEETEASYTPEGELTLSRTFCHMERLFRYT
jgi:hypothetical protein